MGTVHRKRICCECENWMSGDTWGTGQGEYLVISLGVCTRSRKRPRPRWSHAEACKGMVLRGDRGFIYGGAGKPTWEDIRNINDLADDIMR